MLAVREFYDNRDKSIEDEKLIFDRKSIAKEVNNQPVCTIHDILVIALIK